MKLLGVMSGHGLDQSLATITPVPVVESEVLGGHSSGQT